jgi:hypothetical protein
MAGISDLSNIFHHIRVKLYPNYLPNAGKGTFIARTDSDKTVSVKDMCTIMVTRAGFDPRVEANKGIKQTANMPSATISILKPSTTM